MRLLALALVAALLAGCFGSPPTSTGPTPSAKGTYEARGFDGSTWPDLHGAKVTVLAYSSFNAAINFHARAFHNATNGTVELLTEPDSGKVLERAVREKGSPSFDVVYGIDNVLLGKAIREGVFQPYQPVLAKRIAKEYQFAPDWIATPVDHGYIAVNVDPRANLTVRTLDDVKAHASQFVTEDPRTSTPGLGFLLATIATYGENGTYTWRSYWTDLLKGGALVTADWTAAYEQHFTGGYGQFATGAQVDKPIVTSYTTSPAYEMYYGYDRLNGNVLAPKATFHQIQTMGIAKGARNVEAAQAWIEYALTDSFQATVAKNEAIYPVVPTADVAGVYAGKDPEPGSFVDAGLPYATIDANVERWLSEWTDTYEKARA